MSEATAPTDGGQGAATSTSAALVTPATPAAPTSVQITEAPTTTLAPEAPKWLGEADETTVGYVQNKGWTDPKQVVSSYLNLEKLLGADKAGNAIVLPKEGADAKEWNAVFDRLGRPGAPDGYKIEAPEQMKDLVAPTLAKYHELGLTKSQGEALAKFEVERATSMAQANEQAKAAAFQADDQAIKQEWGNAYTQELAKAQQAARGLGLDADTIDKLSGSIGHKATLQLLNKIGTRMGESGFVSGDKTEGFGNAMTPGQAKAAIQTKMADREFVKQYLAKNTAAVAEMATLHAYAYPEEKQ